MSSGAEVLDNLVIIDTPGTLDAGGKGREYDYPEEGEPASQEVKDGE